MGDQAINRIQLSLLKNGTLEALSHTKSLLEVHLKHLIHILLQDQSNVSDETINVLRKSAEEINRTLNCFSNGECVTNGSEMNSQNQNPLISNVRRVMKDVIATLKQQHCLDHLILIESVPSDLPSVKADTIDLEEIFYNLIVNSAQAAMHDGGRLTIDAVYHSVPEPHINIEFRDNGYGIPKEAMPHIFEPYTSLFSSEEEKGIGSGLCVVKQLVERNGGRVSVHSRHPSGLTVLVHFPALVG